MKMLFKPKAVFKEEREIAAKYFELVTCRTDLVNLEYRNKREEPTYPIIGKYSILADYVEYCQDLKNLKITPINTPLMHQWSSRISQWYQSVERFTPQTWFNPFENPFVQQTLLKKEGPFFVRYDTKSKRELWKTHAFAQNFDDLIKMSIRLSEDYKFENEILAVREFVKLKTYADNDSIFKSLSGQPISKEFRVHRLLGQELCRHFYWEPFQEEIEAQHGPIDCNEIPQGWLDDIATICDENSNFYVMDVAQKEDGTWTLIEINEGQHSGVHTDCLDIYYSKIAEILRGF